MLLKIQNGRLSGELLHDVLDLAVLLVVDGVGGCLRSGAAHNVKITATADVQTCQRINNPCTVKRDGLGLHVSQVIAAALHRAGLVFLARSLCFLLFAIVDMCSRNNDDLW